jgi:hypothetical protein
LYESARTDFKVCRRYLIEGRKICGIVQPAQKIIEGAILEHQGNNMFDPSQLTCWHILSIAPAFVKQISSLRRTTHRLIPFTVRILVVSSLFDCVSRERLHPCALSHGASLNGIVDKDLKWILPNCLFASSDAGGEHAAAIYSLIGTAN